MFVVIQGSFHLYVGQSQFGWRSGMLSYNDDAPDEVRNTDGHKTNNINQDVSENTSTLWVLGAVCLCTLNVKLAWNGLQTIVHINTKKTTASQGNFALFLPIVKDFTVLLLITAFSEKWEHFTFDLVQKQSATVAAAKLF